MGVHGLVPRQRPVSTGWDVSIGNVQRRESAEMSEESWRAGQSPKTILVIGTLDTKGEECQYIKELAEKNGFGAIIIDCGSLGTPVGKGDISRREVAERAGWSLEQLIETRDKGKIIGAMTEGLVSWTAELFREQRIHGVIAVGGGQGTAFGTAAMQLLPLGFPKVMVSTIASGNMRPFLQTKDIAVFPAITDVSDSISYSTECLKMPYGPFWPWSRTTGPLKKGAAK